jgi:hypothetical protein
VPRRQTGSIVGISADRSGFLAGCHDGADADRAENRKRHPVRRARGGATADVQSPGNTHVVDRNGYFGTLRHRCWRCPRPECGGWRRVDGSSVPLPRCPSVYYWRAIAILTSLSLSMMSSPETSTTTVFKTPVNRNGDA